MRYFSTSSFPGLASSQCLCIRDRAAGTFAPCCVYQLLSSAFAKPCNSTPCIFPSRLFHLVSIQWALSYQFLLPCCSAFAYMTFSSAFLVCFSEHHPITYSSMPTFTGDRMMQKSIKRARCRKVLVKRRLKKA